VFDFGKDIILFYCKVSTSKMRPFFTESAFNGFCTIFRNVDAAHRAQTRHTMLRVEEGAGLGKKKKEKKNTKIEAANTAITRRNRSQ
jgi:hypothetical protein